MNITTSSSISNFNMKTLNGYILKFVEDYEYLGSFVSNSEYYFKARKRMAWSACNNLHKIWVSDLPICIKKNIFKILIELILLYGCETWTQLLMRIKCLSWKRHPTIQQIYGDLPRVSTIVKSHRLQFAGHCQRATNEVASSFVLWRPKPKGRRSNVILS